MTKTPFSVNLTRQGILWDLDGVLVDTGEYHFQSWQEVLTDYGVTLDREVFQKTLGMNSTSSVKIYLGKHPEPALIERMITRKEESFRRLIQNEITPLPGVLNWLEWFASQQIPMAVASSAPPENIDFIINALQIRSFFTELVSGANMPGKPNPDVFLEAAKRLNISPDHCIVIEDSIAGVAAARQAGMRCIAVATTNPTDLLSAADLVVDNLAMLTRDSFLRLSAQISQ